MTPLARSWLRRIALGLPLGAGLAAAPVMLSLVACNCPDHVQSVPITAAQAAMILDAEGRATVEGCRAVCDSIVNADAGALDGARPDAGFTVHSEQGTAVGCHVVSGTNGLEARCEYHSYCVGGRRPRGLDEAPAQIVASAGAWLARMAWMEAASVDAFEDLADELRAHGAPAALSRACRRAADDERRHARITARLATRRGAAVARHERASRPQPSIEELARENAMEGGVRETFGAVLAALQAERAPDADLRRAMRSIARDEARHAMLSTRIDAWARGRVDGASLDAARAEAVTELRGALQAEHDEALAAALGLPRLETQLAIASALA